MIHSLNWPKVVAALEQKQRNASAEATCNLIEALHGGLRLPEQVEAVRALSSLTEDDARALLGAMNASVNRRAFLEIIATPRLVSAICEQPDPEPCLQWIGRVLSGAVDAAPAGEHHKGLLELACVWFEASPLAEADLSSSLLRLTPKGERRASIIKLVLERCTDAKPVGAALMFQGEPAQQEALGDATSKHLRRLDRELNDVLKGEIVVALPINAALELIASVVSAKDRPAEEFELRRRLLSTIDSAIGRGIFSRGQGTPLQLGHAAFLRGRVHAALRYPSDAMDEYRTALVHGYSPLRVLQHAVALLKFRDRKEEARALIEKQAPAFIYPDPQVSEIASASYQEVGGAPAHLMSLVRTHHEAIAVANRKMLPSRVKAVQEAAAKTWRDSEGARLRAFVCALDSLIGPSDDQRHDTVQVPRAWILDGDIDVPNFLQERHLLFMVRAVELGVPQSDLFQTVLDLSARLHPPGWFAHRDRLPNLARSHQAILLAIGASTEVAQATAVLAHVHRVGMPAEALGLAAHRLGEILLGEPFEAKFAAWSSVAATVPSLKTRADNELVVALRDRAAAVGVSERVRLLTEASTLSTDSDLAAELAAAQVELERQNRQWTMVMLGAGVVALVLAAVFAAMS